MRTPELIPSNAEISRPPPTLDMLPPSRPVHDVSHGSDYQRPPGAMVMRRVASVASVPGSSPRGTFNDSIRRNSNSNNNSPNNINTNISMKNIKSNTNTNSPLVNSKSIMVRNPNKPDYISIGVNKEGASQASNISSNSSNKESTSGSIHVAVSNILTSAAASSNATTAPTTRKLRRITKKRSIISSCAFIVCSTTMVMCNKGLASVFPESSTFPTLLVAWQCAVSIFLCFVGSRLGYFSFDEPSIEAATRYLPVSCIFVAMVFSSFMALAHLTVPTVTVVKNLTNIIIVLGDWYAFGNQPTSMVYLSFGFMVAGAAAPVFNDLSFSLVGYGWMAVNCVSTAVYVLALRWLSVKIPPRVATGRRPSGPNPGQNPNQSIQSSSNTGANDPSKFSQSPATNSRFEVVLYNNSLAAPMLLGLAFSMGEMSNFVAAQDTVDSFNFGVLAVMSGAAGFFLNVASLWCLGSVSATTYAIVGSLNKVPIIVLGHIIYGDQVTTEGAGFVALAVAGALLYSLAKLERKSD